MQLILEETLGHFEKLDIIQKLIVKLITNEYFAWTCLVLIVSQNNWKRPINFLLILHWLLRSIGDMFLNSFGLFEKENKIFPFSNKGSLYGFGVASIFWYSGEIIGDWYFLIRSKVLVRNKKKLRWVFYICLGYNLVKIAQIFIFLSFVPFPKGYSDTDPIQESYVTLNIGKHTFRKWVDVALQQIFSLAYDISVIIVLKNNVFNKMKNLNINENKENTFLIKFKQISEYRIYMSILVTIIGAPFIFGFCLEILYLVNQEYPIEDFERIKKLQVYSSEVNVEGIRVCILTFNYMFMYIDQILLRFFVEDNKPQKKISNSYTYNKNSSHNYNMVYHKFLNYDELEKQNLNNFSVSK
ncbi:hypothetical protein LY90DRAFT_669041 [Neocallimastix californiae]|jgi:hypothetical protein|uniref:G-protein coupled receptors family 1 profile domain-containing protein n=1 Tax=Neocallimastix californiae TaxID=1754190 RepID=A0A1Y2DGR5_9FUNG|nr:hypothetical protein LY90DRAFT_669041 [Neocallimastix californiae]|eukprot:ORY58284.1 hypothetical protein LY90DRAFT_669041 [Neocallimastix californiae]